MGKTLFDKVWDAHVVQKIEGVICHGLPERFLVLEVVRQQAALHRRRILNIAYRHPFEPVFSEQPAGSIQ